MQMFSQLMGPIMQQMQGGHMGAPQMGGPQAPGMPGQGFNPGFTQSPGADGIMYRPGMGPQQMEGGGGNQSQQQPQWGQGQGQQPGNGSGYQGGPAGIFWRPGMGPQQMEGPQAPGMQGGVTPPGPPQNAQHEFWQQLLGGLGGGMPTPTAQPGQMPPGNPGGYNPMTHTGNVGAQGGPQVGGQPQAPVTGISNPFFGGQPQPQPGQYLGDSGAYPGPGDRVARRMEF